jgi:hypothetical protein
MFERINYGLVRKVAEQALEIIPPRVRTINAPGSDDYYIVPPESLQQFTKLVFTPEWIMLQHQTPPGEEPHIETTVEKKGSELKVEEYNRNGEYTEVVFDGGRFIGAVTWDARTQTRLESAKRENLRRIKNTLKPNLS